MSLSKVPVPWGSELIPHLGPRSPHSKRYLDRLSRFAWLMVITNRQTDRQTKDRPRYSVCSNRPLVLCMRLLLLHPFNGLFSKTTWVSRYQKGKTTWDLGMQWRQLVHMQTVCSRQTTTPTPQHSIVTGWKTPFLFCSISQTIQNRFK